LRLGENARKRVVENFDIEKITARVLKIYFDEINGAS
jgi:glycosyltransferase involved in cell wall biosynthesis